MKLRTAIAPIVALTLAVQATPAQFRTSDVDRRDQDERFLRRARVVDSRRMSAREGVTRPYKLTLGRRGRTEHGLFKDVDGVLHGFLESWRYEVAAYRLDRFLGLGMVPPTVERRFDGRRGSCQLWVDVWKSLRETRAERLATPPERAAAHQRAVDLQRAFDNLIGNIDRHPGNVLLTRDWRLILIDHSRAFRTGDGHTTRLIYRQDDPDGPQPVRTLPAIVLTRLEALDARQLAKAVGPWLTEDERAAVLARRALLLRDVKERIERLGRDAVVYEPSGSDS